MNKCFEIYQKKILTCQGYNIEAIDPKNRDIGG